MRDWRLHWVVLGTIFVIVFFLFARWPKQTHKTSTEKVTIHSAAMSRGRDAIDSFTNNPQFSITAEGIALWIESDAYCEESNKQYRNDESIAIAPRRKIQLYEGLVLAQGSLGANPCVQAMLADTKEDVLYYAQQSQDLACRFIHALTLTGQWELSKGEARWRANEHKKGVALLEALHDADPENGFYLLFLLGAADSADVSRKQELYRRFLQVTKIQNPLREIQAELKRLGHTNPTAYLYAIELYSSFSIPKFSSATKAAKQLAREGVFAEEFAEWVRRLNERWEKIDQAGINEPSTNLVDDAALRSIALSGKGLLPDLPGYLQKDLWQGYFQRRALSQDLSTLVGEEPSCEETLDRVRERFGEWLEEDERQFRWLSSL